jgi:adenylate kinase family enzyme
MGVRNYLIEGVSGSVKTTVAEELGRRGHHVVHGDRELSYQGAPETGEPIDRHAVETIADSVGWRHKHHIWSVEKVEMLVSDQGFPRSFFCGGSRNFHQFIALFDEVFVLELDIDTLRRRLAGRLADEFGGGPAERALVERLWVTREDTPKNAVSIDATA